MLSPVEHSCTPSPIRQVLWERAEAAVDLYHRWLVQYLLPTGGVEWDTDAGGMSEANYLAMPLEKLNVPKEAILLENEATTTRENMLYCALLLERKLHPRGGYGEYIVTSPSHLRRALRAGGIWMPFSRCGFTAS